MTMLCSAAAVSDIWAILHVELHPLFNAYLTMITNVANPSGVIQPRATWNVTQNFELTLGGNLYYGAEGTEYGGFELPGTEYLNTPGAQRVSVGQLLFLALESCMSELPFRHTHG